MSSTYGLVRPVTDNKHSSMEDRRFLREREARKIAELALESRSQELFLAQQQLEQHYANTIEVFASLMSGRSGRSRSSLRMLARRARRFGEVLGLAKQDLKDLKLSAMLCDIGKLTLSDELLSTPIFDMNKEQFAVFTQHPRLAYEALLPLDPLLSVARIVRDHTELFDGSGYPKGKTWEEISLNARVLCLVKDHDAMLHGFLTPQAATETGAREFMLQHSGTRYDAELVEVFLGSLDDIDTDQAAANEKALHPSALIEGMILTRDLTSNDGVLMLGVGHVLTKPLIEKLFELEMSKSEEFVLYVVEPTNEDKEAEEEVP